MKKIIIDTDIGGDIDDIWALIVLLSSQFFDVKMISVTQGDIDYQVKLVAKILTQLNRKDIPIVKGITGPIKENVIYPQKRWIGDFDISTYDGLIIDSYEEGYEKVLNENSDVSIIALAPFTSLQKVISILQKHNVPIIAMAGSVYEGYFGSKIISPECNIVSDIQASKRIFESGLNITLLPLDVCNKLIIKDFDYKEVKESPNLYANIIMQNYKIWQEDYVGGAKKFDIEVSSSILYDLAPILFALFPQNFDVIETPIYVDDQGYTRLGGTKTISAATRVHKLDVMLQFVSEQLCTNIETTPDVKKMGIEGRYMLTYVLKKSNIYLSVNEYGWEKNRPGQHYGPTKREYYILHFVTEGKGTLYVGNKKYDVSKGDCFLLPPNINTYYEADFVNPYTYHWIGFSGIEAKELLEKSGFIKDDIYVIRPLGYDDILSRFKSIDNIIPKKGITRYLLLADLYLLLSELIYENNSESDEIKDYVDLAIKYMNTNYSKKISINDVTQTIGIERTYFYRLFYKNMNISPQDYLIKLRLEKAKLLLCNTLKPIKDVAISVGYDNYVSFIKIFKEKEGISPTLYRRNNMRK